MVTFSDVLERYNRNGALAQSSTPTLLYAGAALAALAMVTGAVIIINSFVPGNLYTLESDHSTWNAIWHLLPYRLLPQIAMALAALLAAVTAAALSGPRILTAAEETGAFLNRHGPAAATLLIAVTVIATLLVAVVVLRSFPNSADEYDYLFQARTFLEGRLWQDLPELQEFFRVPHIFAQDGKWVSQYPPGWPLVLAAGIAVGLPPAVMGPLAGTAMIGALAWLTRMMLGWATAVAVCTVVLVSGFFLLNAGSYFTHVFVAFLMLGFTISAHRFLDRPSAAPALAAGAFIGMMGITRYYSAILCFLPFLVALAGTLSWRRYRRFLWALLTIAPFLAGLLAYNHAITGSALKAVTQWGYPLLRLGLWGMSEYGTPNSPIRATALAIILLNELMEWTSPLILAGYALALGYLVIKRTARFHDYYFVAFVLGYMLFFDSGSNRYGPRYYFEAYPFLVLTVATALHQVVQTARDWRFPCFLFALAAAHLVIAACNVPAFLSAMNRAVVERMDLYDQVAAAGLENAVVMIGSGTGVLRPMPSYDLARNGTRIGDSVIYVNDLGERDAELIALFPDRTFWRYQRRPGDARGCLVPWRPETAASP